jgi:hypothetical protein
MPTFFLAPLVGTFQGGGDIMVVSGNANCRKTSLTSSFIWKREFLETFLNTLQLILDRKTIFISFFAHT